MTAFEEMVLRDLGEMKTHIRWIVGNGNEGKMQELEKRVQKQEAGLQRMAGLGAGLMALLTLVNVAINLWGVLKHG